MFFCGGGGHMCVQAQLSLTLCREGCAKTRPTCLERAVRANELCPGARVERCWWWWRKKRIRWKKSAKKFQGMMMMTFRVWAPSFLSLSGRHLRQAVGEAASAKVIRFRIITAREIRACDKAGVITAEWRFPYLSSFYKCGTKCHKKDKLAYSQSVQLRPSVSSFKMHLLLQLGWGDYCCLREFIWEKRLADALHIEQCTFLFFFYHLIKLVGWKFAETSYKTFGVLTCITGG